MYYATAHGNEDSVTALLRYCKANANQAILVRSARLRSRGCCLVRVARAVGFFFFSSSAVHLFRAALLLLFLLLRVLLLLFPAVLGCSLSCTGCLSCVCVCVRTPVPLGSSAGPFL